MFVNLHCGDCDSSMRIDLQKYMERCDRIGRNVLLNDPEIKCFACGSRFPQRVNSQLHGMLYEYLETETNWKISFDVKDLKTANGTADSGK